jgi:predicted enzyme related to lactoylglutathione lyase
MNRFVLGCLLLLPMASIAQEGKAMQSPIVFFDIAGPGSAGLNEFYSELFGWNPGADGNLRIDVQSPLFGTFRVEDVPETLIYIGVEDVTAKLAEVTAQGGAIDFPRLEVPGVVILGMFRDPAGNRVGLVEINDEGTAVVPPVSP